MLSIKYKIKAKGNEDEELCVFIRSVYCGWGNEYDEWYIIPNIAIFNNGNFGFVFNFLKFEFTVNYFGRTHNDESAICRALADKHNKTE